MLMARAAWRTPFPGILLSKEQTSAEGFPAGLVCAVNQSISVRNSSIGLQTRETEKNGQMKQIPTHSVIQGGRAQFTYGKRWR